MTVRQRLGPYWKAVLAFIAPGAVIIGSSVLETSDAGTAITSAEWITAAVACIVSAGAVYTVPNETERPRHDSNVRPAD